MINIIYEDNHIIVVNKPINIPVQEDSSNDLDLLNMIKQYLKGKYNKPGNVYLGLVHRLDRPVGGVMVFAKTSKAASRLSEQVRTHKVKKIYLAIVEGCVDASGHLTDYLLKSTSTNMVTIDSRGKEAVLDYELVKYANNYSLIKITLKTGRSHQIRVQFSSRNHPIYGDQRYNNNAKVKEQIALLAQSLSFYHPITKEEMTFSVDMPNKKPWTSFN